MDLSLLSYPNSSATVTITSSCSSPAAAAAAITILSKCTVYPDRASTLGDLPLSVSDLPMLSCHYIQKGLFFPPPPTETPIPSLLPLLRASLARVLSRFPALAGRLYTAPDGRILISCNDAGVDFHHAAAPSLTLPLLLPPNADVPEPVKRLFPLDGAVSYSGHFLPLAAFQVTELGDGAVFVGCAVNHAVVDGTSFWHFFNTWAWLCRSSGVQPETPDFHRNFFGASKAVLRFPCSGGGPEIMTSFPVDAPLRERIFHFTREAIRELKSRANRQTRPKGTAVAVVVLGNTDEPSAEVYGKRIHDRKPVPEAEMELRGDGDRDISSFQSLCALLWRSVTRARKHLRPEAGTTFRMAVNCRGRVVPHVGPYYFGNAIQSVPTTAAVGEVVGRELRWAAVLLHGSVAGHGDAEVRRGVAEWEAAPRCFPLGNADGAGLTMGSSPRFPMYEGNDFGWGGPVAVRSGRANKFDGKISAFPGREGGGSVDLEVVLVPETMAALLEDEEFTAYASEA